MKSHHPISWSVALCLALAACGGGGGDSPPQPQPVATQLNASNMLDAVGVAALAHQRMSDKTGQLMAPVLANYIQQAPAGSYACAGGGTFVLARPAERLWTYTAQNCDTGTLMIQSGQLQLDASLPDGQGLNLQYSDVAYRVSAAAATDVETATGLLTLFIPVASDLGRRTTGNMSVTSHGRADTYSDFYIASKTSDAAFTQ